MDKETNYYFYNARHYDPEICRFVTADDRIDGEDTTQGWNRFAYVKNNPIIYKDPTGHSIRDGLQRYGEWLNKVSSESPAKGLLAVTATAATLTAVTVGGAISAGTMTTAKAADSAGGALLNSVVYGATTPMKKWNTADLSIHATIGATTGLTSGGFNSLPVLKNMVGNAGVAARSFLSASTSAVGNVTGQKLINGWDAPIDKAAVGLSFLGSSFKSATEGILKGVVPEIGKKVAPVLSETMSNVVAQGSLFGSRIMAAIGHKEFIKKESTK